MHKTLRAVAESVTDAIIFADPHGHITFVNASAERLLRWPATALIGKPLAVVLPDPTQEEAMYATHFGRILKLAGLRRDGVEFEAEVTVLRVNTPDDSFFTLIFRDIKKGRRAERYEQAERWPFITKSA